MNAFNGAPYILDTFLNKFLKNKNKIFFRRFLSFLLSCLSEYFFFIFHIIFLYSTPIFTPKRTFDI